MRILYQYSVPVYNGYYVVLVLLIFAIITNRPDATDLMMSEFTSFFLRPKLYIN